MTEITCEFSDNRLVSITLSGHSGYGTKGNDVVCAGVSALIQALSIGLEKVLGLENVESVFNDGDEPFIRLSFPDTDDRVEILTKTIQLSLKEIEKAYPNHVILTEVQI